MHHTIGCDHCGIEVKKKGQHPTRKSICQICMRIGKTEILPRYFMSKYIGHFDNENHLLYRDKLLKIEQEKVVQ